MEIIDNERELKGFHNMDDVIKLVGYFKSEKSPRRFKAEPQAHERLLSCLFVDYFSSFSTQISSNLTTLQRSSTPSSSSLPHLIQRFQVFFIC